MAAFSVFRILWKSIRKTVGRGPTLIVLFLFLGVTSYLTWNAAAAYGRIAQAAVAVTTGILWTAACIIATNTLVDSETKLELSSMYLTDYKGIAWTTATMVLATLLFDAAILLCAALFLLPFMFGDGTALVRQVVAAPRTLSLTQGYVLLVQVQSLLLATYVGTRLLLYPAYVAVESKSFLDAMRASVDATQGHVGRLAPVLLVAAAAVPVALAGSIRAVPVVLSRLARFSGVPYLEQVAVGGVYALCIGTGAVFALALVATAYSAVR